MTFDHLPDHVRFPARFQAYGDPDRNRRVIEWALWRTGGRVEAAAKLIGAHRNTVSAFVAARRSVSAPGSETHNPKETNVQPPNEGIAS